MKKGIVKYKIWILVLAVLVIGGFIWLSVSEEGEELCNGDEECVRVQITCCPCSMGGEEMCVHRSEVKFYENRLKEECDDEGGIICPAVYNCEDDYVCKCVNGICR